MAKIHALLWDKISVRDPPAKLLKGFFNVGLQLRQRVLLSFLADDLVEASYDLQGFLKSEMIWLLFFDQLVHLNKLLRECLSDWIRNRRIFWNQFRLKTSTQLIKKRLFHKATLMIGYLLFQIHNVTTQLLCFGDLLLAIIFLELQVAGPFIFESKCLKTPLLNKLVHLFIWTVDPFVNLGIL